MGVPPESTTVEIDLVEEDRATTLHLVHRGIASGQVEAHRDGRRYLLGRLEALLREN